jgi:long-chain acyl-CoA synthetase
LTDVGNTLQQHEILLMGGNGFLGKVFLALLADRCPKTKHLHLLLRPGRSTTALERFENEILESPALAAIAARLEPGFFAKAVTVWPGDVSRTDCGLSSQNIAQLQGRVRLIVNCAGKVDFFPPVDDSFASNVDGAANVVALAKKLDARLLHVSTCFVSGEADGLVEESEPILGFYPRRKGPRDRSFDHEREIQYCRQQIRQIYESAGKESANSRELKERLAALGRHRAEHFGWVNTYTYAKSLGEQIIAAQSDLDWTIVRPAIVESSLRFPFPGWIEGGRTASPLVLMALGGMKHWPVRRDTPLEVVPVDMVASAMIVVAALLLSRRHERVYQLGTADVHPIKLGKLVEILVKESAKRRRRNGRGTGGFSMRGPGGGARIVSEEQMRSRRRRLETRIRRMQSLLKGINRVAVATGLPGRRSLAAWAQKLRSLELQAKFREQTLDQYLPFVLHNRYIFECENIRGAYSLISPRDRRLLPWDPEHINWKKYWIEHQIEGIEKWIQPEAVRDWSFKI